MTEHININNKKPKIALISLGCPKNQVDAESMLCLIEEASYQVTDHLEEAEAIIVNTCGFIQSAKEEAISAILDAAEYKTAGSCKRIIVSGCLAQRYADEIEASLPEVDAILGVAQYGDIVEALDNLLDADKKENAQASSVMTQVERKDHERIKHLKLNRRPSNPYFAYLKVSEGCRHHCAYCAIPGIRGSMISRPMHDILEEARALISKGIKEIVLVAQDTSSYGLDLYGVVRFPELLDSLAELEIPRIRFLYAYADGMSDQLLDVMSKHENFMPYIDLPIQHASDRVLKSMYRRDRKKILRDTFLRIRSALPNVTLRTTVMLGFPGEDAEDFEELKAFVKEINFDHLGAFVFSPEEGTAAAEMDNQVPFEIAQTRYEEIMSLQQTLVKRKIKTLVGEVFEVLIEGIADDGLFYYGRSSAQAPEIDSLTYVLFEDFEPELGEIYPVRIVETQEYDLIGVCQSEPSK